MDGSGVEESAGERVTRSIRQALRALDTALLESDVDPREELLLKCKGVLERLCGEEEEETWCSGCKKRQAAAGQSLCEVCTRQFVTRIL